MRGSTRKIAATAAKDSWKPGSSADRGIHARSTSAPTASACQRSRGRATIHASDASVPATAARTTDGCQPTASAYERTTRIASASPTSRPSPTMRAAITTPTATMATFWPDTASRCWRPLAWKASRSSLSMPESSPRTMPVSRRRRSPVVPRASVASTCARSRSPTPPIPPRRPTMRQPSSPRNTTCTPRRASQPRSSKPVSGPRGATGRARSSSTAPWGGARSGGSSSSTRSRMLVAPNRTASAGVRTANAVRLTGPVTTTRAGAVRPSRSARTLRSSASFRSVPHQSPRSARATAVSASLRRSRDTRAPATAIAPTPASTAGGGRTQVETAMPAHADHTRSAGQPVSSSRTPRAPRSIQKAVTGADLTASPDPGAARCGPARSRARRRGRRPT